MCIHSLHIHQNTLVPKNFPLHILIILRNQLFTVKHYSLSRICSKGSDFVKHNREMASWPLKREYPEGLIKTEMEKLNLERD